MLRNGLEPWHLLIVVLVVILLFGSKKLPDTARALGKSLRIFKSETRAMKSEAPANSEATPKPEAPSTSATPPVTAPPAPLPSPAPDPRPHSATSDTPHTG
ncbi:Sec-independent protein translocase subunit TatA [Streptomyces sp. MST-110588]|uniref:Sec-independent protein translocase subunit TatA n=1 Tax=Streptomyces sp. MST-110588 TaxID=2833628 RepID=UPI001F5D268B|nr:Sec-independent protein translocase subunit TatA [Streptomyces sp. MST-110588]